MASLSLAACSGGGGGGGDGCQPTAEICDGLDNDCDGQADDGLGLGAACSAGVGQCETAGTVVCGTGGGTACSAVPGAPSAEVCDGADNDCDGSTDEGYALGTACSAGVGQCARPGTIVCTIDGGAACSAVAGAPSTELCNQLDDDCDGTADEGFDTQSDALNCGACGNACSLANATAACVAGNCQVAACDPGYVDLNPAVPGCEYLCTPTGAEACGNGVDDDCDGSIDEGCTQVCTPAQSSCGTDHRTRTFCNASGTAWESEACPFYCDAGACVAATGIPDDVVAACGPAAPAFAPQAGQTVTYRQGATDPEIVCSTDCGGGRTVVTVPFVFPATGPAIRALCASSFELPAGVVLTYAGTPPPLTILVDGAAVIDGEIDFDGRAGGGNPGESGRPGGAGGPGGDFGAAGCTFASCSGIAGPGVGGGGGGVAGALYGGGGGGAGHETPGASGGTGGANGLGGFAGIGFGSPAAPGFGSGGGSGARGASSVGSGPGGGGGGGIRIFARHAVSVSGIVSASGGRGGDEVAGSGGGGGGSGGTIRLEARAVGGPGVVRVDGGNGGASGPVLGGLGATFSSSAQSGRSSASGGGGGGGGAAGFVVLQGYLDSDGDGIPDMEDTCPSIPGDACTTISDIRLGLVPEGASVGLEAVVVTAIDAGGLQQSIWVQDANPSVTEYGGIRLFFGAAALPAVQVGDLVIVTGVYGEFQGASQLTSPTATPFAAWGAPAPIVVSPADVATGGVLAEAYEGMLVSVQNVTVTTAPDAFGELVVTGGLRVDDLMYAPGAVPVGTTFSSITGILHFANGNTKLEPRSAADVVP